MIMDLKDSENYKKIHEEYEEKQESPKPKDIKSMSIDEAIDHCNEVAKQCYENASYCETEWIKNGLKEFKNEADRSRLCADEHKKLEAWLRELRIDRRRLDELKYEFSLIAEGALTESEFVDYCREIFG